MALSPLASLLCSCRGHLLRRTRSRARLAPPLVLALLLMVARTALAESVVLKRALGPSAAQPILANGSLEALGTNGFAGWGPYGLGYAVDAAERHSRRHSARCRNPSERDSRGLLHIAELDQPAPAPIFAECWSKAENVSPGAAGDYALYLDLEYTDGTPLWAQIAPFDPGTHDWQRRAVTVHPAKPVKRVAVYGLLRNRSGTAWFDDFGLWQQDHAQPSAEFDRIPILPSRPPEVEAMSATRIETADGLAVTIDSAASGICVRDAAAQSDFIRPVGTVTRGPDGSIGWAGRDDELGLELTATYRVLANAVRVDGEVRDLRQTDRAITVYFTFPVDAVGWQWHDDQRAARTIEAGAKYDNFVTTGAGANGVASRYPLACISGQTDALALAVPLDVPRLCRLGYDADSRELYAAFDLGLAPDTDNFPSRATFSLALYRADPEWGFRSALQRYYQLFPHCFTKRNAREGIWMPFTDIATVEGFEDFGFQFKEGDDNVPFDAEHGIYSFVYVEPWSNWVRMPRELPRTTAEAIALVQQRAADGSERDRATMSSALGNADGSPAVRIENQPWCDGAVMGLNPSPGLLPQQPGSATQFDHLWRRIEHAFARSPQLTGVYHDSFEMYLFPNHLNYRRDHWRRTTIPLVFDQQGRPCQFAMFTMVEFAREIARRMWARGGMTFANGTPHAFPWGAAWLDVMGTETCWAPSWGAFGSYQAEPDANFNYWRSLCYQRPYLLLLNTRYDLWQPEWFELYMKRCTAYAAFPGFFSHNASEDPYWRNPDLYNRHRPLFKKYIPVISALSAAGWEPITCARSDNPKLYLERFGKRPGAIYLTVFNDSRETQQAAITLDWTDLGLDPASSSVCWLLPGSSPGPSLSADGAGLRIELAPEDVHVLALK